MNILVTNISYHCSIGVIKLLKSISNYNIQIFGTSNIPYGYSSGSLMVNKFFEVTSQKNSKLYLKQIKDICINNDIDFIISSDESEQQIFNIENEFFSKIMVLNKKDVLELFTHKLEATKAIEELGILTPKIYNNSELHLLSSKKIIIRENVSCCSYGIHILENSNINKIHEFINDTSFVQEYIDGDEYTVDVLCDISGFPIDIIPRRRLAIRCGITYKCQIEKNEILINECKKIYEKYCIPGFSNVQFIIKNNKAYFIELNPRLGGTTIASSLCSDNLIEKYINHFVYDEPIYRSKIHWNAIVTRHYEENVFFPN